MRVLIACEFSGIVRDAFANRGHDAWSCDLIPSERNGHHIQRNVIDVFLAEHWDMMIAFPPCTHLCVSGARWFKKKQMEQNGAILFCLALMNAPIQRIAMENPIGVLSTKYRKPDQIIQPWQFGHGETKATCLWLKNLPPLMPTHVSDDMFAAPEPKERLQRVFLESPGPARWKNRSRTYRGIADAMAAQWG